MEVTHDKAYRDSPAYTQTPHAGLLLPQLAQVHLLLPHSQLFLLGHLTRSNLAANVLR